MLAKFTDENSFKSYKIDIKNKMMASITNPLGEHDALYDAELALKILQHMQANLI